VETFKEYQNIDNNFNTYFQGRIYARAKGARAQGGILKKIEIELWYAGKKRLSTREKFKGDLY
jgi:hypothetical protein